MPVKRFMIAPIESGQQTDVKPWLIADDAFALLENVYLYYGLLRKRFGSNYMNPVVPLQYQQLYSRLGMNLANNTNGAGHAAGVIPGAGANAVLGIQFGVGNPALGHEIFTVVSNAAGAQPMLATGAGNGTFNFATGAYVINASIVAAPVYYYPTLPVMGLPSLTQAAVNDTILIGFDTRYAYTYEDAGNGIRWEIYGPLPPAANSLILSGTDSQFIWSENYRLTLADTFGMFVTNNNYADGMFYLDPTVPNWTLFQPRYSNTANDVIVTARCIVSFKTRLLLFGTNENQAGVGPNEFPNRIRYSQEGNPLDVNSFNTNTTPGGGYIDMPTTEAILSVRPLKDRIIMGCENSTWELVFTNNQAAPFKVQRINDELGIESGFSTVLFDKAILGIGNVGIHSCNGTNVERIDEKIRQTIFSIENDHEGTQRVYGIRDYVNELVYWAYPDNTYSPNYPNKVLVYNYRKGSWATNDDSITCFGNFNLPETLVWADLQLAWQDANFAWNQAEQQDRAERVIAGNQEGFTFVIDVDLSRNAPVLSITNIDFANADLPILEVINHNRVTGEFILVENVIGANLGDMNGTIYQIQAKIDNNHIQIFRPDVGGQVYRGAGTVALVSEINVLTKQYNFFQQDGRNAYISKVDFNVDRTPHGEITIDYATSTSDLSLVGDGQVTGALLGTAILETSAYAIYPYELTQTQLWHPVYIQADGQYIQFRFYLSTPQMLDPNISLSDFQLNAFTIYAEPTSSRLQ